MISRVSLILSLFVLAVTLSACSDASSSKRPVDPPVAVRLAPVRIERAVAPIATTGTLASKDDVDLSFKIGGVVARVLVDEGATVHAGQLLASLDLSEIDAAVERAEAAAEKADRDQRRASRLYADSVVTLAQLQDAGTARDAAFAERDAARFDRRHAQIVAPSDGVVLRRRAEPGQVIASGQPVLAFGGRSRGQVVRVGLPDRDLVRLHEGDPATVRFDALPDRTFSGQVSQIGAAADPVTGTYTVEIALRGAGPLVSGLVAAVEIAPRALADVALVPIDALIEADGERASVFTLGADHRAQRRPVQLAFVDRDRVAIRAGLDGVAQVITEGAGRVRAGELVEVVR